MEKAASLYLDVLRLAAALVVFTVHAHYLLPDGLPVLWRLAEWGGEAVYVFFILSGFVIAYVVHSRKDRAADYLSARFARLYSVVLPALLVTMLLDVAGAMLAPSEYPASFKEEMTALVLSAFFSNEVWFISLWPPSNIPFWSLSYEFWYYMIYAAAYFIPRRGVKMLAVVSLCALSGPKIVLLMPIWLLGVGAFAISKRMRLSPHAAALLALASFAGSSVLIASGAKASWRAWTLAELGPTAQALEQSAGFLYAYAFSIPAALHIVAMVKLAPWIGQLRPWCEHMVRKASAHTFAIYLLHFPILKFLVAATATMSLGLLQTPLILALTLAIIALLGTACERVKTPMKRWFQFWLDRLARVLPASSAAVL
ncbi:acyltransferase family protein [Massilia endophytica]|uniref:acyltransferase family protein n=1 Tax=Massilia endophytica TaxID=2899220 RepID=UPI001E45B47D|nr:acyltransferase [Massilia endophytica]UGQ46924.1 acyltransferase [Massilia endophytica]